MDLVQKRKDQAKAMLANSLAGATASGSWGINYGAPTSGFRPQSAQRIFHQSRQRAASPAVNPGGGSPQFNAFMQAISTQESGGNYGAVGVPTNSGTALGKYQILDSNIAGQGGWDMEALGREISAQQFLRNPKLQDQIARAKLKQYFQTYGAEGAAKAWYAGPGNANSHSTSPQYGGPSIQGYANSVLSHMLEEMK